MRNNLNSKIHLSFDDHDEAPLHQKIERWFINRILKGCFAENERLPSIRELATSNYISANTVKKAFQYLESSKWIHKKKRLGIFVCYKEEYREEIERNREIWLQQQEQYDDEVSSILTSPLPIPEEHPTPIFETMLLNQGGQTPPAGSTKWAQNAEAYVKRVAIQVLYEQSGMVVDVDTQLMLFTQNERALSFVLRTLFGNRGNWLLVAGLCSGQDKKLFDYCNMLPITIRVNKNGIILPHLTAICKVYRPKVLMIDTSLYYMDASRVDRLALENLLHIIREYNLLVIERNPDRELWYGQGRYPLLSTLDSEHVIYLGAISNLIEPLNRVRTIRAPEKIMRRLCENEVIKSPNNSDEFMIQVATLLAGYKWRKTRKELYKRYGNIRDMIKVLLDKRLSAYVSYHIPPSGLACWLYPRDKDFPESLATDLLMLGDTFALRSDFYSSDGTEIVSAIYFAFGHLNIDELDDAIELLVSVLDPAKNKP